MRFLVAIVVLLSCRLAVAGCGGGAGGAATTPPPPMPPPPTPARAGDPLPPDEAPQPTPTVVYRERIRPRFELVGAGVTTLGVAWLSSAIGTSPAGSAWLAIPFAGPIVEATRSSKGAAVVTLLGIDAAVQLGGLALAIAGGAARHRTRVAVLVSP